MSKVTKVEFIGSDGSVIDSGKVKKSRPNVVCNNETCLKDACKNIYCPKRDTLKYKVNIRQAFVAREGYVLAAMDYSGEELRLASILCLPLSTKIKTSLGNLDLVQINHRLKDKKSIQVETPYGPKSVKKVHFTGTYPVYEIKTKSGKTIRVSENHKFLVERDNKYEFVSAKHLTTLDNLITDEDTIDIQKLTDLEEGILNGKN